MVSAGWTLPSPVAPDKVVSAGLATANRQASVRLGRASAVLPTALVDSVFADFAVDAEGV
jgi:hypothetical protein